VTLIALTSAKHSPGVTTAALACATAWSAYHESLLVEADPAGGDLAARLLLPFDPDLVSLAAASRHHGAPASQLDAHLQPLPGGGSSLLGPGSPEQAGVALSEIGTGLFAALAGRSGLTVVDCGRWSPTSPARSALRVADLVLVVLRPTLEGIVHLRSRAASLGSDAAGRLGLLLVGERPYTAAEVQEAAGIPVTGVLADDPRGAAALYQSGPGPARRLLLVRSARSLLETALGHECGCVPALPGKVHA
jgi:hypothetical protein